MKTYRISFVGKPIGSICAAFPDRVTREVQAESPKDARLMAYDTHEHIAGGADWVLCQEVDLDPPPECIK